MMDTSLISIRANQNRSRPRLDSFRSHGRAGVHNVSITERRNLFGFDGIQAKDTFLVRRIFMHDFIPDEPFDLVDSRISLDTVHLSLIDKASISLSNVLW